jgi:hypothetical protein
VIGGERPCVAGVRGLELGKVEDRIGARSIAAPPGKISGPKMESKGSPDMQAISFRNDICEFETSHPSHAVGL